MAKTRPLGYWETIQKTFHQQYRCAGMILQVVRIEGGLTGGVLAQALALLQLRHPLLRARFGEAGDRPTFIVAAPDAATVRVPLRVVPMEDDGAWQRLGESEALRDFEGEFLWRAILLEGAACCDLIFLIHHAIADGHSIVRLVHDLMALCRAIAEGRAGMGDYAPLPLLPPVDELLNRSLPPDSPAGLLATGEQEGAVHQFPFEGCVPAEERRLATCFRQIEKKAVALFQSRCRSRGVTPTGAITAALLQAAAGTATGPERLAMDTGISLRRYCEPEIGPEHVGCNIMMLQTSHSLKHGGDFWSFAAACQQELRRATALKQRQGFLPRRFHPAFVASSIGSNLQGSGQAGHFANGICFSNPGVLSVEESYGPFRVQDIYNVTCETAGLWLLFLGTHVLHGRLYCDFSFAEPLASRTTVEGIADRLVETIRQQACG
jgi:hypothetical protein